MRVRTQNERQREACGAGLGSPCASLPLRYTGREFDSETGLYYYRARYYDPTTGRFISEDPIGLRDGVDLYVYVHNGPTTSTDPQGLYQTSG